MNKTSVALGTFDGLHKGHREVISQAVKTAEEKSFEPTVMLFDVHPQSVLKGVTPPGLMTDEKREETIHSLGAKTVTFEFKRILNLTKEEFFYNIISGVLNAGAVSCGENFRFGKNAEGNVGYLKTECEKNGVILSVLPIVKVDGESVSSTKIRSFIQNGEIEKANRMLGRNFSFSSTVLDGKHLGRKLGIPTINQLIGDGLVRPKKGVYASFTTVDGKKYKSVTNIGLRPTVENTLNVNCETHILDFSGNLYGKNPEIELVSYIRDEKKFESVNELREQIERDINKRKTIESE
ncbi:MAG: bifunctional riboflavin kinase/FAD synthetase [Clostridiales bacterium]|nr:bifunctional riboflavin kinase/FAD synthetase [Clostridiales bacterium]